jgi:rare lipoprotein A
MPRAAPLSMPTPLRGLPWLAASLLAACASGPVPGPARDGPEANPPAGLEKLPDAVPRIEPLRSGGPNKPYEVLGQSYTPIEGDRPLREKGLASWYGRKFHGRPTASGERYDMYAMTAAHKTMPLPSYARVRNPANGREIVVRVNDRGPFHAGRIIDLSYSAALKLGVLGGVAPVEVERLTHEQIRAGTWRRDGGVAEPAPVAVELPAAPAAPPVPRSDGGDPLMALLAPPPPLQNTPQVPSAGPAGGAFWLQLGAFRQRDGAAALQQRVQRGAGGLDRPVVVLGDGATFRVQAGPFATRAEALEGAEQLRRSVQISPLLVERR